MEHGKERPDALHVESYIIVPILTIAPKPRDLPSSQMGTLGSVGGRISSSRNNLQIGLSHCLCEDRFSNCPHTEQATSTNSPHRLEMALQSQAEQEPSFVWLTSSTTILWIEHRKAGMRSVAWSHSTSTKASKIKAILKSMGNY